SLSIHMPRLPAQCTCPAKDDENAVSRSQSLRRSTLNFEFTDGTRTRARWRVPVVGEVGPPCSRLAAPVAATPVPSAAPAPAERRWVNDLSDVPLSYRRTHPGNAKLCASRRQHHDAAARWLGVLMERNVSPKLHDREADLSGLW